MRTRETHHAMSRRGQVTAKVKLVSAHLNLRASGAFILAPSQSSQALCPSADGLPAELVKGNERRLRGPAAARPPRLLDCVPLGCPEAAVLSYDQPTRLNKTAAKTFPWSCLHSLIMQNLVSGKLKSDGGSKGVREVCVILILLKAAGRLCLTMIGLYSQTLLIICPIGKPLVTCGH